MLAAYLALCLVLALSLSCRPAVAPIEAKSMLHLIDVGQGESILLQAGSSVVLIDAGEKSEGDKVVDYLKQHNVRSIDLLITTHPHADHIGGAVEVLNSFSVKRIIDSGKAHTSKTYLDYLTLIDEKNIPFETAEYQDIPLSPDVTLKIIGPVKEYSDLNNNSVVALVLVGAQSILLTGDMEADAEKDLLAAADVSATVLKVGHHGSNTSSSDEFLAEVKPKLALISVGEGNSYGHPNAKVMARLESVGAVIYRTDLHGTVRVAFDGTRYAVYTTKNPLK